MEVIFQVNLLNFDYFFFFFKIASRVRAPKGDQYFILTHNMYMILYALQGYTQDKYIFSRVKSVSNDNTNESFFFNNFLGLFIALKFFSGLNDCIVPKEPAAF